jgi:hypothetical protein
LAELKPGPPYVCKLLKPSNGKNLVEPKNEKFISKSYTFDITKCDEIFDLLVTDGQIIVPKGLKLPPIEQRKKKVIVSFIIFLAIKPHNVFFSGIWSKRPLMKEGSNLARNQRTPKQMLNHPKFLKLSMQNLKK